jgi:hypothetical protein
MAQISDTDLPAGFTITFGFEYYPPSLQNKFHTNIPSTNLENFVSLSSYINYQLNFPYELIIRLYYAGYESVRADLVVYRYAQYFTFTLTAL